jgi:hypothetical protein
MTMYHFGLHTGHLTRQAQRIAARHGANHTNYTEPNGERRGWFSCPNRGDAFNRATARAVAADITEIGGIDALRKGKRT